MASNDWFDKDFYAQLGVPRDASQEQVKKAYRKLARTLHPDTNGGDPRAEQRFKEIGEAYSVLSDPEQRQQYDAIRAMAGGRARFTAAGSGGGNGGFEDLLGGMFGGNPAGARPGAGGFRAGSGAAGGPGGPGPSLEDLLGGMFGPGASPYSGYAPPRGPRPGADMTANTRLGFRQAVEGSTVTLTSGGVGSGGGGGSAGTARTITARIPAGVRDGQRIRLRGKGSAGTDGGPPGDLVITVAVDPHPVFTRSGDDLRVTLPITFDEAALGAEVDVPTLDGSSVRMKVPTGTSSGRTMRLRGRGVTTAKGTGDLLVTVQVVVPQRLDDQARAAVEAFRTATSASGQDPRADLLRRAGEV